jgi:predicted RNase H-like HicB family nuclease
LLFELPWSYPQLVVMHERRIPLDFTFEVERETDGRWIAEVPELPGVLSYGASREEAIAKAQALALRVLADRLEHGEAHSTLTIRFKAA